MEEKKERKLTKAEEERKKQYLEKKEKMQKEGYEVKELTIGVVFANVMALVLGIPLSALFVFLYYTFHHEVEGSFGVGTSLVVLVLFFALIVVHELIHGATWAIFAKGHFKSISFGVIWQYLTPYCCCRELLSKGQYILGGLMPTIILGILPWIYAVVSGNAMCLAMGCLMILGGGGDMTIVLKMLLYHSDKKEKWYLDHPYECGMVVFEK